MVLKKACNIEEYKERIKEALQDVVELNEDQISWVLDLLREDLMECWLLMRDGVCNGYAITHLIYDQPSNKDLLLVYLLKTLETVTSVELQNFYNDLLGIAREKKCSALTFFSSFQNEKNYKVFQRYGAIVRAHFYIPV